MRRHMPQPRPFPRPTRVAGALGTPLRTSGITISGPASGRAPRHTPPHRYIVYCIPITGSYELFPSPSLMYCYPCLPYCFPWRRGIICIEPLTELFHSLTSPPLAFPYSRESTCVSPKTSQGRGEEWDYFPVFPRQNEISNEPDAR